MSLGRAGTPDFRVIRDFISTTCTMGKLFYKDQFVCYTLEDPIREVKIKHETAIPAGIYELKLSMSNRFKIVLPEILEVPGFSGVRMHGGNFADHATFHKYVYWDDRYPRIDTSEHWEVF